jgi:hypothetical protein
MKQDPHKNTLDPLEKGAALSTVVFVEEPIDNEKAEDDDQPPSKSNENDAD